MEKIKVNASLIYNNEKHVVEVFGYFNENMHIISYVEDDFKKTVMEYNIDKKILRRDNEEIYLEYDFLKNTGYLLEKEHNLESVFKIEVLKLIEESKLIDVIYRLNDEEYEFKLEMEEV